MEPNINTDDNFIMSPKIDFAFKLLFGDPKNIDKDEKARSEYEAREAEIHDQMTIIKTAREEGANEKALRIAEKMIKRGDSVEDIVDITELLENEIIELRNRYLH